MQIRNAIETDFMTCFDIAKKAWPEFAERESIYHIFCKHFSRSSFVLEAETKIAAFLLGFFSQTYPDTAYIHLVAVLPAFQRKGYAGSLYQRFFQEAAAAGKKAIDCIVNPENATSLHFHQKLGFVVIGDPTIPVSEDFVAVRDYNGPGKHMVLFRKTL